MKKCLLILSKHELKLFVAIFSPFALSESGENSMIQELELKFLLYPRKGTLFELSYDDYLKYS